MAFSEKVKKEVRKKSCCRCIICYRPFVEIHHIIPMAEGGSDNIENAAPLCAYCHDIYGNNSGKRKQIKEMRDIWYEIIERRYKGDIKHEDTIKNKTKSVIKYKNVIKNKAKNIKNDIAIYHLVYQHEDFEVSAKIIYNLLVNAQKKHPGNKRYLYLDIEGHRNKMGGYDQDMLELQKDFLLKYLMKYFTEINLPLINCKNPNVQENNICEEFLVVNAN